MSIETIIFIVVGILAVGGVLYTKSKADDKEDEPHPFPKKVVTPEELVRAAEVKGLYGEITLMKNNPEAAIIAPLFDKSVSTIGKVIPTLAMLSALNDKAEHVRRNVIYTLDEGEDWKIYLAEMRAGKQVKDDCDGSVCTFAEWIIQDLNINPEHVYIIGWNLHNPDTTRVDHVMCGVMVQGVMYVQDNNGYSLRYINQCKGVPVKSRKVTEKTWRSAF
jgi:hypothetical protein